LLPAAPLETPVSQALLFGQITVAPASRQLNGSNWNTGRNFGVTPVDDGAVEGTQPYRLHFFASGNMGTQCASTHIIIGVNDND
jgi:hypothetical protein